MADVPGKTYWGARLKILLALAVFCALLFLIYSWLAFAPTGYSNIEPKQSEAVKRFAEEMRPAPAASRANETNQPAIRVIPLKPDLGWSVTPPYTQTHTISSFELGMDSSASVDQLIAQTKSFLPQIVQASAAQHYWNAFAVDAMPNEETLADSVENTLLTSACDLRMIPNPLSGNPEKPGNYSPFDTVRYGDKVLFLAAHAVRRACARNQPDKAVALLEKMTELTRQLHLNEFPNSAAHLAPLQRLLLQLAHTPQFPAEGFARARAILDRAHLDDVRLNQMKMAYIAQVGGRQLEFIRNSSIQRGALGNVAVGTSKAGATKQFKSNDWHFFMDGGVEKTGFNVLKPMLMRAMEQGFVAMANGDPDGIVSAQEQVVTVSRWMNLREEDTPILLPLENQYAYNYYDLRNIKDPKSRIRRTLQRAAEQWRDSTVGEKFNEQIDITRLILAYAHFCRANNRPPASVAELIPNDLDASFAAGKTVLYEIVHTKPYHALKFPMIRDQKEAQTHPFFVALRRLHTKPVESYGLSYESLIGAAQTDPERKAVEDAKGPFVPASAVLCQIRPFTQSRSDIMRKMHVDELPNNSQQTATIKKAQTEALAKIFGNSDQATFISITAVADAPTTGTRQ